MMKLSRIDLSKSLDKAAYRKQHAGLELKLGELQRQARDLRVPSSLFSKDGMRREKVP